MSLLVEAYRSCWWHCVGYKREEIRSLDDSGADLTLVAPLFDSSRTNRLADTDYIGERSNMQIRCPCRSKALWKL